MTAFLIKLKSIYCLLLIYFASPLVFPFPFNNRLSADGKGYYFTRPTTFYDPSERISQPGLPAGFALVELFTSEGCSSCPPADEAVGKINTKDQPVYVLSFHVDYWGYLGWKDPYSSAAYSERQREYGNLFRLTSIYTPQIIVNGTTEFSGGDEDRLQESIGTSLKRKTETVLTLSLERSAGKIAIHSNAAAGGGIKLNLALVQLRATDYIRRGENKGRTLHHFNIVRDFQSIANGKPGDIYFENIPAGGNPGDFELVAFLQKTVSGEIISATRAAIP